jgi:tetratricopeptide (TPR) repeat protein
MRVVVVRWALAWTVIAAARPARADESADALVLRGLELRRAGKPTEALDLFRRAHEASPSARTLGQMGLVETSLRRWLDADAHLRAALATPDDAWVRNNRPFLAQALDRTGAHVGELLVAGPPGADVTFGGRPLGKLPLDGPVRAIAGNFRLIAAAPGQKTYSTNVEIRGSARVAVAVTLEPITTDISASGRVANDEVQLSSQTERHRSQTAAGVSLMVVGAAAIVWGASWIAVDSSSACAGMGCEAVYATRRPGWLLAGAGAAVAAAGVAVLFYPHRDAPAAGDLVLGLSGRAVALGARF